MIDVVWVRSLLAILITLLVFQSAMTTGQPLSIGDTIVEDFDADVGDFALLTDVFYNTNAANYSHGSYVPSGGVDGTGGLSITLGGIDKFRVDGMSGGWKFDFELAELADVAIQFSFKVDFAEDYDAGEFSEVLCSVDDIEEYNLLVEDPVSASNWTTVILNVSSSLAVGSHSLLLGGYNNRKTSKREKTTMYFDSVTIIFSTPTLDTKSVTKAPASSVDFIDFNFQSDEENFTYHDDLFLDSAAPAYANGYWDAASGDGALVIDLGGIDNSRIEHMSGGWIKNFTMETAATVVATITFRVDFSTRYDIGEYTQVLFSIDRLLAGTNGTHYLFQADMNNTAGLTDWMTVSILLGQVTPGTHMIAVGGYNNLKTRGNEASTIWISDVLLSSVADETPSPTAPTGSPTTVEPTPSPTGVPTMLTGTTGPAWKVVEVANSVQKRHESCFVMVGSKAYLFGGRRGKNVGIYDPIQRKWGRKSGVGYEFHHQQCVAVDHFVYMMGSFTGNYPGETNIQTLLVYDTQANEWFNRTTLPAGRRRGAGAAALYGREILFSHGNLGGHGPSSETVAMFDKYNVDNDTWTVLPDAHYPRDHTGGDMVGGRFCVAGGRKGDSASFFDDVILPTECYNFTSNEWEIEADIPFGRAGAGYGRTCNDELMVAGGEGFGQAYNNVDVFNGTSWRTIASLNVARHGTSLAVSSCECNQIHIASGAGNQGGGPELTSLETLFPDGIDVAC